MEEKISFAALIPVSFPPLKHPNHLNSCRTIKGNIHVKGLASDHNMPQMNFRKCAETQYLTKVLSPNCTAACIVSKTGTSAGTWLISYDFYQCFLSLDRFLRFVEGNMRERLQA